MKEFDLIKHYFSQQNLKRKDVLLGIGDDCAIVQTTAGNSIAVTTDTLVQGVHFPDDTPPKAIGHKAIAVNLSDLAAMGASPAWVSLAITLPSIDEFWVKEFCTGIFELCNPYNVKLIGGDTTQGPMSITVTAQGILPSNTQITRSGAKAGDLLYVTGNIGDAALALQAYYGKIALPEQILNSVSKRLDYPQPRIEAGLKLRGFASSLIDISDGLLADLTHICRGSYVGAHIKLEKLPLSTEMITILGPESAAKLALSGGDDYELLFTVPVEKKSAMEMALKQLGMSITCIGEINQLEDIQVTYNNQTIPIINKGYEHFSEK